MNEHTPIPPVATNPSSPVSAFEAFIELVKILRSSCPWDKKQTHQTLAPLLLEETYETLEAIEKDDMPELKAELGDILLHVVMHATIAEEQQAFSLAEIITKEHTKLVQRHPHVFGSVTANTPDEVKKTWEQVKMSEGRTSVFEGVPTALPALLKAHRLQEKAAGVGFDWNNTNEIWLKIEEELAELREALQQQQIHAIAEEMGDVLFSMVNLARKIGVAPEQALQAANQKFISRFSYIEQQAAAKGTSPDAMTLEEMDALWNEAKQTLK